MTLFDRLDFLGSLIKRPKMVRLFASILRHDQDGTYYLVTPVEKFAITVDDAPFQAVAMTVLHQGRDQVLTFPPTWMTSVMRRAPNIPFRVEIDPVTEEPSPYLHVRARLEALISRAIFYDLGDFRWRKNGGEKHTLLDLRSNIPSLAFSTFGFAAP